jgi:hypothetical protein
METMPEVTRGGGLLKVAMTAILSVVPFESVEGASQASENR